VQRFFTPFLRRLYVFLAVFIVIYAVVHFGQYTRQSFRAALKINPRDRGLRRLLQQTDEVIRKLRPERLGRPDWA